VCQGPPVKNFTILACLAGKNSVFRERSGKIAKKLPKYADVRQIVARRYLSCCFVRIKTGIYGCNTGYLFLKPIMTLYIVYGTSPGQ
jgi:hypothetical protein